MAANRSAPADHGEGQSDRKLSDALALGHVQILTSSRAGELVPDLLAIGGNAQVLEPPLPPDAVLVQVKQPRFA
jgi:hypothetical protein